MPVVNYIWDVVSDNVLMEMDDEGNILARYVQEPNLYGEAISMERDGQTRYYNYDGLGNTVELTDENQNVTDTYEYTAFGEQIAHTGTTENPLCFKGAHGYYTYSDTNDVYVRERTYEPRIGRWLSVDPLGFIDGINCHEYVGNDPVNRTDPSGTFTIYPPIWLPGVGVPTACSCCCCAERAKFSQCVKWKNGDCGLRGLRAGWMFSADLSTAWIPHSTSGDCTFEWWEKASIATAVNPNNINTWQNVFRPEFLQFKPWRERRKPCLLLNDLNKESIKITDCPTLPVGPRFLPEQYDLAIAIKLISAADCDCPHKICVHYMQCRIWSRAQGRGSALDLRNFKCFPVNVLDPVVGGNPPGNWPAAGCQ